MCHTLPFLSYLAHCRLPEEIWSKNNNALSLKEHTVWWSRPYFQVVIGFFILGIKKHSLCKSYFDLWCCLYDHSYYQLVLRFIFLYSDIFPALLLDSHFPFLAHIAWTFFIMLLSSDFKNALIKISLLKTECGLNHQAMTIANKKKELTLMTLLVFVWSKKK